jgi:N-acyl homoserine lactone hydrolase
MRPVRRVSVVSTGTVEIHPEHVARSRFPLLWWLLTSRRWTDPRPINVYVIEHEAGLVLFDTGQDRMSVTDRSYFPRGLTGVLYSRLARFTIGVDDTLAAQLEKLGYDIADVRIAVVSHLHQDHIGGLAELRHAEIVVAAAEIAAARAKFAEMNGYLTAHIFLPGLSWRPVEGERDLFDDGSLMVFPTPGHTPGSLSMLVRQEGLPPLLFVGDLTYDVALLAKGHVPGVGTRAGLTASTRRVARLAAQHPGLVVLAAHDPTAKDLLTAASSTQEVAE